MEEKQKKLEHGLSKLKVELKGAKNERVEKIENKLKELQQNLEQGWDRISEEASRKLNQWLRGEP